MLDYKDIIIKHYALKMSGRQIASQIGASKINCTLCQGHFELV